MPVPFVSPLIDRLVWTDRLAMAQRFPAVHTDEAAVIAVASIDDRMLTNYTCAVTSMVVSAVSAAPVAVVDADGVNQPMRGPLGSGAAGDIMGLVSQPPAQLSRRAIETFADTVGAVPLVSAWLHGPGVIPPDVLVSAVRRAQHRWPTVVMNLPYTCQPDTISSAMSLASHVLLVTDRHHQGHGWLYQPGHQLSDMAAQGKVSVVMVGGDEGTSAGMPDTVSIPDHGQQADARSKLRVPLDPASLARYHRLLARLYSART